MQNGRDDESFQKSRIGDQSYQVHESDAARSSLERKLKPLKVK
jgi:hypothetical protein